MPKVTALTALTSPSYDDLMYVVDDPGGATPVSKGVTVQNLFAGVINVKQHRAIGNGIADDTAAIQEAINALTVGSVLYFPPGNYAITDTLDMTDLTHITIQGNQAFIRTRAGSNFTNKGMINLCGTYYSSITNLNIDSNILVTMPAAAVILGRTIGNAGGGNTFRDCLWGGNFTVATVYNVSQEVDTFYNVTIRNYEIAPCIFDSATDHYNLTGGIDGGGTNCRKYYYGCNIHNYAAAVGGICVQYHDFSEENSFHDCYFYAEDESFIFSFEGALSHWNFVVENARTESGHAVSADSRFIKIAATTLLGGASISNIDYLIDSDAIIEVAGILSNSKIDLRNNNTNFNYILVDAAATLNLNILYFDWIGCFNVAGGGSCVRNIIMGGASLDGNPFTGAGAPEGMFQNSNIVLNANSYSSVQPNKQGYYIYNTDDATPSVKGYELFEIGNVNPTSITALDDGVVGQKVILVFLNNNTTLVHGSTLKLAGSINWNPAQPATITLLYDPLWTCFVELCRTVP